jgi:polyhydroxybutyrate depolymerase
MKKLLLLSFSIFTLNIVFAQVQTGSFAFGGTNRTYTYFVPSGYTPGSEVPLLLVLHGLGDVSNNMMNATGFNAVADTANFIGVYPQALDEGIGTSWNSGANPIAQADDVGFLSALIDTLSQHYSIDQTKVYSTGFSMGGMMSYRLACELGDKIAAIASVSGPLGNFFTCNPTRAVPVMHMHGTSDATVSYEGTIFSQSVDATMSFWSQNNNCSGSPEMTMLPDIASDNYTVETSYYSPCDDNTELLLYTIDGAGHIWMGPSNDVYATREIWLFLRQYNYDNSTGISNPSLESQLNIYPNPVEQFATISIDNAANQSFDLRIIDDLGREVKRSSGLTGTQALVDTENLPSGAYFIEVIFDDKTMRGKMVVQK